MRLIAVAMNKPQPLHWQYVRPILIGAVAGAAFYFLGSVREASELGKPFGSSWSLEGIISLAVCGAIVGAILFRTRDKRKERTSHMLAYGVACTTGALLITIPSALAHGDWMSVVLALLLGMGCGFGLSVALLQWQGRL